MIYIGCHLSVTNGYEAMGKTMLDFGGNTFAYFTQNPRGGKSKEIVPEDAAALNALLKREGFGPLVAHGSYTMNLCAANPATRENGLDMLEKDLARMEAFPGNFYNFHPGAHVGQGTETGIALIADALKKRLHLSDCGKCGKAESTQRPGSKISYRANPSFLVYSLEIFARTCKPRKHMVNCRKDGDKT